VEHSRRVLRISSSELDAGDRRPSMKTPEPTPAEFVDDVSSLFYSD
jgi:hypothetical protein